MKVAERQLATEALEDLLEEARKKLGIDWEIKCDVAAECCWGIEVRITPFPNNPHGPDVSAVLFRTGFNNPDQGARAIMPAVRTQLGVLGLAVPKNKRGERR